MDHPHSSACAIKSTNLFYSVHHFKTSSAGDKLEQGNKSSLADLILKKKAALTLAFETLDVEQTGEVTRAQWAEVMQSVTTIRIRWLGIISTIAPADSLTPSHVNYRKFLNSYTVNKSDGSQCNVLDSIYANRKKLETVFNFFDTNGDGVRSLHIRIDFQ
jgi:3-methyladenine DNA glycosylase Tag